MDEPVERVDMVGNDLTEGETGLSHRAGPVRGGRATRSELTAARLGREIVEGVYPPGSKLPVEDALAEQLKVSRNALREAVKMLRGKGLLTTAPRRGTIISPTSSWSLLDPDVMAWAAGSPKFLSKLTEFRQGIEPTIAALAAERATKADVAAIYSAFLAMTEASDPETAVSSDLGFHESLIDATHNPVYAALKPAFVALLRTSFENGVRQHNMSAYRENLDGHRAIVEAISAGDAQAARHATERLTLKHGRDVGQVLARGQAH